MKILRYHDDGFHAEFSLLRERANQQTLVAEKVVKEIIAKIRSGGDEELKRLTKEFDGHETITVDQSLITESYKDVDPEVWSALQHARDRIEDFHRRQLSNSWVTTRSSTRS